MEESLKNENSDLIGTQIKFKGRVMKIIYPRHRVHSGDFAIFKFMVNIDDVADGGKIPEELMVSLDYADVTIKGTVPELDPMSTYSVVATLQNDPTYGLRYDLITMNTVVRLTSRDDQRAFFEQTLAPTYVDALMNAFEDPIEVLEAQDVQKLCTVKGIGEVTAYRLIRKYEDTKDRSLVYVELANYGLTSRMIDKLAKAYGSVDILVEKIKENPYSSEYVNLKREIS